MCQVNFDLKRHFSIEIILLDIGATPAIDCPAKKSGNLCDCGNKICNYGNGEYLEPATCTCKTPLYKRSINKRATANVYNELHIIKKPFVVK